MEAFKGSKVVRRTYDVRDTTYETELDRIDAIYQSKKGGKIRIPMTSLGVSPFCFEWIAKNSLQGKVTHQQQHTLCVEYVFFSFFNIT